MHPHDILSVRHFEVFPDVYVFRLEPLSFNLLELILSWPFELITFSYLDLLVLLESVYNAILNIDRQEFK